MRHVAPQAKGWPLGRLRRTKTVRELMAVLKTLRRSRRDAEEEAQVDLTKVKRKDFEQLLREQKEKEEREEQELFEEMQKKKVAKRAGLKPLGPVPRHARNSLSHVAQVMVRDEAIDPLQKVAIAAGKLKLKRI